MQLLAHINQYHSFVIVQVDQLIPVGGVYYQVTVES